MIWNIFIFTMCKSNVINSFRWTRVLIWPWQPSEKTEEKGGDGVLSCCNCKSAISTLFRFFSEFYGLEGSEILVLEFYLTLTSYQMPFSRSGKPKASTADISDRQTHRWERDESSRTEIDILHINKTITVQGHEHDIHIWTLAQGRINTDYNN